MRRRPSCLLLAQLTAVGCMQRCRHTHLRKHALRECSVGKVDATPQRVGLAQGLAVSYQPAPAVTATSVTYPFVQDVVLGFPGNLNAVVLSTSGCPCAQPVVQLHLSINALTMQPVQLLRGHASRPCLYIPRTVGAANLG